jgi:hypothetical protein
LHVFLLQSSNQSRLREEPGKEAILLVEQELQTVFDRCVDCYVKDKLWNLFFDIAKSGVNSGSLPQKSISIIEDATGSHR